MSDHYTKRFLLLVVLLGFISSSIRNKCSSLTHAAPLFGKKQSPGLRRSDALKDRGGKRIGNIGTGAKRYVDTSSGTSGNRQARPGNSLNVMKKKTA
uniref:Secreted protein n=1 Tax=Rhipicephalus appendiculatus TaxID=34631 RepID=A0A131YEP1_RHIAP